MTHSAAKHIKTLLKLALVVGLLALLTRKGFISVEATSHAFSQTQRIVPAMLALLLTTLLAQIRWQWLLKPQSIHMPFPRTFQLGYIGNFFNIALPGAVSGDFVKAFYVAKEVQGLRARAFGSILFDRVAGLSALVLVSAGALLLELRQVQGTELLKGIQFMVILAACVVVALYGYLFLVREKHDPLLRGFKWLEKRSPKAGTLTRIYEGLRHYHSHRWTVLKVLLISIAIHLLVGYACIQFLAAFGDTDVSPLSVLAVFPLGLLVTAVPIMPAGIGTGHAAFGWLFHLIGSQRGADVFSLFALSQLAIGALGGLVYLRFRSHAPRPSFETA